MADPTIQRALALALEHHRAGRLPQAESLYRQILAGGFVPEACTYLAVALLDQARVDEAIESLRQAIAARPDYPEAHNILGNALRQAGRLDEAIVAYEQAIALDPRFPDPHNNLASALEARHRPNDAIAEYRRALALHADYPEASYNLGSALLARREFDEAIEFLRLAIKLRPNFASALNNLAAAVKEVGELDEAINCYRQAVACSHDPGAASNLIWALHCHPGYTQTQIKAEQDRWNTRYAGPLRASQQSNDNAISRSRSSAGAALPRLRIGYVSPDLRDHPAGRYIFPLLANHDHSRFEVFCYSDVREADEITRRIKTCADAWRETADLTDAQLADQVRRDGIDILIDMTMHMAGNRLLTFARKPAPLQVTGLGYPAGTGLDTMDYRLSDFYLDPPGLNDEFYCEKTVRLPNCYWCYDPMFADLKCETSDSRSGITFGCLNTFSKANAYTIDLWGRVLARVANSKLLVLAPSGLARQRLLARLERHGITAARINFTDRLPRDRYMELYRRIDIALDTYPYNGHTTTLDSLWMGVPVISLSGQSAVSRGGLSILSNLGLSDLATDNLDRYIEIATALASDRSRRCELRSTLRARMQASPLMDAPRFAKGVEAAYRYMWENSTTQGGFTSRSTS